MKKVLIIDDDYDILSAVELTLETHGFDTIVSTSGRNIHEKIQEHSPDLIILDYLLSGKDGTMICSNLKRNQNTKDIPIILFSAHPTAKDMAPNCGADSFIPKPFSVNELLNTVNCILTGNSRNH